MNGLVQTDSVPCWVSDSLLNVGHWLVARFPFIIYQSNYTPIEDWHIRLTYYIVMVLYVRLSVHLPICPFHIETESSEQVSTPLGFITSNVGLDIGLWWMDRFLVSWYFQVAIPCSLNVTLLHPILVRLMLCKKRAYQVTTCILKCSVISTYLWQIAYVQILYPRIDQFSSYLPVFTVSFYGIGKQAPW